MHTHKTHLSAVVLLLIVAVIPITACSALFRKTDYVPIVETGDLHVSASEKYGPIRFDYPGVKLTVSLDTYRTGLLAVGPLGIPFMPWPRRQLLQGSQWDNVHFSLFLDSAERPVDLDLSGASLSSTSPLPDVGPPLVTSLCSEVPVGNHIVRINPSTYCSIEVTFLIAPDRLEMFHVSLGAIAIDGQRFQLPEVTYRRQSRVKYDPFVYGD